MGNRKARFFTISAAACFAFVLSACCGAGKSAQASVGESAAENSAVVYDIPAEKLRIRDPFVFADKKSGKYRIGVARSPSGKIDGKWIHDDKPLNEDDGGHAMVFKSFDGKTKISYHAPNSKTETRLSATSNTKTENSSFRTNNSFDDSPARVKIHS